MSKAIGTILILYTISKIFADGISELQLQNTVAK
jgi:hypothetical protein